MPSFPRCSSPIKFNDVIEIKNKYSLFVIRKNLTYLKPKEGRGEGKIMKNTFRNIEFIYIPVKVSHSIHGYHKRYNTLRV